MTLRSARSGQFAGTGRLVRFNLRRDKVKFPAWVLGITFMVVYFTSALPILFGGEDSLAESAGGFLTGPVVALFGGPGYGFDELTYPRFFVGIYGLYVLIMAATISILMVSRHTRTEEQTGRAELVRANVVGRMAQLSSALVVTLAANAGLVFLIALVLIGKGYQPADSLLFGSGVGAVGLAFAGITAITVQLSEFSRTASGIAGVVLGAAYAVRTAGDAIGEHGSALSWFSPLAWSQQTRPFVDGRWWPLLITVAFAVMTVGIGYALAARRDFGAGLLRPRQGSPTAPAWLGSPLGLAFRLQRGSIIGWSVFLLAWGYGNGAIVEPVADGLQGMSPEVLAIFGGDASSIIDGYLARMGLYSAALIAVFVVLGALGIRSEESGGGTEPVLATATSRSAWLGSNLIVLGVGSAWLLAVTGVGMGVGAAAAMGEPGLAWDVTASHLAFIPAVLVILGIAGLLYGVFPGAMGAAWAVVGYGFVMGFFAPLWDLPQWVLNLSPFEHVPAIPLEEFGLASMMLLGAVSMALVFGALAAFRNRDLIAT